MSEVVVAVVERYRAVLRTGHEARAAGDLAAAVEAYRLAASLAPDRPQPCVHAGFVLLDAGEPSEALAAFGTALTRSSTDEAALAGRAEALWSLGRPALAAAVLDRIAALAERDGRLADAVEALSRGVDLDESDARSCELARLSLRLRAERPQQGTVESLADSLRSLERLPEPAAAAPELAAASPETRRIDAIEGDRAAEAGPSPAAALRRPAVVPLPTREERQRRAEMVEAAAQAIEAEAFDALQCALGASGRASPPDAHHERPVEAGVVEVEAPDLGRTLAIIVEALERLGLAGMEEAALDLGARALALFPGAPRIHLELVRLYLSRRWESAAAEKLLLLERLATLDEDEETRREVVLLAGVLHDPMPSAAIA